MVARLKRNPRVLALLRAAKTTATAKYSLGGLPKKKPPAPVTLPKLKILEPQK